MFFNLFRSPMNFNLNKINIIRLYFFFYHNIAILAYEIYVVKCLYDEVRLQNTTVLNLINLSSMRHSAQFTSQNSHLVMVYSTMALMPYFLWILLILGKRTNRRPTPPNYMPIQV